MNTIYLDAKDVPAIMRGSYTGTKFRAHVCESMTIPMDAGLWSGGTREVYSVVDLDTGNRRLPGQDAAPWDRSRKDLEVVLRPGLIVVMHSYFCGKDMGLTFYVHPENAAKLLPAPVELTVYERTVLRATLHFKSSYMGKDRYEMEREECRYSRNKDRVLFPTRTEWDEAKATLITRGMLNKAGAITTKGRNALG
jgi:hypothetical protein